MIAQKAARVVADIVYREIDVQIHPQVKFDVPTICVANHFGGLSDAILVVDTLPVMPRIVARDVIWKIPVAGTIMRSVGAIPVHRRADGPSPAAVGGPPASDPAAGQVVANDSMFDSCFAALRDNATILIFPEGVTQEDPHIAPIKTGAARIALGAARRNVQGLQVVPVGVHYEDKAGFRNSALVNIGAPIRISDWLAAHPGDEPDQVRALTAEVELALRAVAPDYPDWQTCRDLELAADVMLHDVDAGSLPVRYGDRCLVADHLSARAAISAGADVQPQPPDGPDRGRALLAAVGSYRAQMRGLRVGDLAIRRVSAPGAHRSERSWIGSLLLILLLGPYALVGLAMVALPWLLVKLTRLARLAPAVQASLTPAVVILVFGLQWASILWRGWDSDGFSGVFVALVLPPFFVAVAVFVVERIVLLARRAGVRRLRPSAKVAAAQQAREAVGDAAWELV